MPENLYPQLPTAPQKNQESFNIEMVRKYCLDIANLKEQYTEKQWKYKNAYNRLLHASTGASSVALVSGVSTIGTSVTIVGFPINASLAIVSTVSTCCCSSYSDFLIRHRALVKRLLSQDYKVNRLSNTFKKFYGRHTDLVGQYGKNVCQMFADSIS